MTKADKMIEHAAGAGTGLDEPRVEASARRIREAADTATAIAPLRHEFPNATIDDAYAIQQANMYRWIGEGRVLAGAKIGLTAAAVQQQLGVDQPDFGSLYADMEIPDGEIVPSGCLIQPKVEAEVAFIMGDTPDPDRTTTADLIKCIDYVLPAIEIVDSRIANWDIGIFDTVADNASSGLFVLGTRPVRLEAFDLRLCGMVLHKNGQPTSFGAGAACLGNPLHAVRWLAQVMTNLGRPLKAGDIVLSGALGPMVPVSAGDHVEVRIAGLGDVRVGFAAA